MSGQTGDHLFAVVAQLANRHVACPAEPGKALEGGVERQAESAIGTIVPLLGDFRIRQDQGGHGFGAQLRRDADLGCLPDRLERLETLAGPAADTLGPGLVQQRQEQLFLGVAALAWAALKAPSLSLRAISFWSSLASALASASVARNMPQVVPTMPPTSASSTSEAASTGPLCRRTNFAQPIARRRRTRLHRLVVQVALHVGREGAGRLVAAVAVLLQGLHHDPVQLAAEQLAQPFGVAPAVGGHGGAGLAQAC